MRLIDADKTIDSLGNSDMDFAIGAVIDEQPTAFDVDKVAKQLENYLFEKYCIEGDATIDEIVKGGGAE